MTDRPDTVYVQPAHTYLGADVDTMATADFERGVDGKFYASARCSRCGGEGGRRDWPGYTCFDCNGSGTERRRAYTRDKWLERQRTAERRQERRQERREAERRETLETNRDQYPEAMDVLDTVAERIREAAESGATETGLPHFLVDLARKRRKFALTERQAEAAVSAWNDFQDRERRKSEAEPVPEGKGVTLEGEVVKAEHRETAYGGRDVMTVRLDGGGAVWGSVPADLARWAASHAGTRRGRLAALKGERVSFTANVERADDRDSFGFFKRPRKAEVVGESDQAAA